MWTTKRRDRRPRSSRFTSIPQIGLECRSFVVEFLVLTSELWEKKINSLSPFEMRRSLNDVNAADNCSLTRLQELSEMFQENIAHFRDQLMVKKSELSAAAMVVVRQYREKYEETTAALQNTSWVKVTSEESNEAFTLATKHSILVKQNKDASTI